MRVFSVNTFAVFVLLLSLAAPTSGAVLGDEVWEEEGIVLRPHSGPNGQYASVDGNGNLSVDLGDDLNAEAVNVFEDVFDVSNAGPNDVRIWITHDATEYVEFSTDGSGSIQGEANGTVLSPGETEVVDVTVDTHGAAPGTQVIQEMSVHARPDSSTTSSGSSGGSSSGSSGGSSGGSTAPTGTPREPTGTLVASGAVRVRFDRELRSDEDVRIERLDGLPSDPAGTGVTAVAARRGDGPGTANRSPASADRLDELGVDTAVTPGETLVVSGTESLFPSASSLDPRRRTAAIYDVTPPRRLQDDGATIWITVNRSALDGVDSSEARVARRTDGGWQLVETDTTRVNDTHVEVRARTPGFSVFALFPETDVDFRWTFDGEGSMRGENVPLSYDEPGVYEGTLAVTDALGRSDETSYSVLVNDRPRVRIERPARIEPGEPATLRANVTDEFGGERVDVTWEFDDGTVAQGPTVTRTFERGEHAVTVTAVDEFDAAGRSEAALVAGKEPIVQVVEFTLGVEGRLALVALVALLVVGALRWINDRRQVRVRRRSR